MSDNAQPISRDSAAEQADLEEWVRVAYERCHPEDTFGDLKQRAQFSKEARGLLQDWMAAAQRRNAAR